MKPVQAPAPEVPCAPALTAEEEAAFQAWSLDGYHLVNAHCRDEEITGTYCRQKLQFSHPSVTQGMELDEAAETLHRLMMNGYKKLRDASGLEKTFFMLWRTSNHDGTQTGWQSFSKSCPLRGKTCLFVLPRCLRGKIVAALVG